MVWDLPVPVEIDKPRLEQRLGDGFECGVGFAQEGDAVVEKFKRVSDYALVGQAR